jgi:hypothetical protein
MFSPGATDLIDIARQTLVNRVLALLPDTHRYEGLMIANALGIALRELQSTEKTSEAKQQMSETVARLLGESMRPEESDGRRRLAAAIRAGKFDPGSPGSAEVKDLLAADVRARLAIDDPKALA